MIREIYRGQSRERFEILEEVFFPAQIFVNGKPAPPPQKALDKYRKLVDEWETKQEVSINEIPILRLLPTTRNGEYGYVVMKAVVYPPYIDPAGVLDLLDLQVLRVKSVKSDLE